MVVSWKGLPTHMWMIIRQRRRIRLYTCHDVIQEEEDGVLCVMNINFFPFLISLIQTMCVPTSKGIDREPIPTEVFWRWFFFKKLSIQVNVYFREKLVGSIFSPKIEFFLLNWLFITWQKVVSSSKILSQTDFSLISTSLKSTLYCTSKSRAMQVKYKVNANT